MAPPALPGTAVSHITDLSVPSSEFIRSDDGKGRVEPFTRSVAVDATPPELVWTIALPVGADLLQAHDGPLTIASNEYVPARQLGELSLEEVVIAAKEGDGFAWAEIIKRTSGQFERYLQGRCKEGSKEGAREDRVLAEELLADLYSRLWQKIHLLQHPENFTTWAHRVMINLATRRLRPSPNRPTNEVELDLVSSMNTNSEIMALDREQSAKVHSAIASLPDHERTVVERHYLQGEELKHIAKDLHVPSGTLKRWAFNARQHLRESLAAYFETDIGA